MTVAIAPSTSPAVAPTAAAFQTSRLSLASSLALPADGFDGFFSCLTLAGLEPPWLRLKIRLVAESSNLLTLFAIESVGLIPVLIAVLATPAAAASAPAPSLSR